MQLQQHSVIFLKVILHNSMTFVPPGIEIAITQRELTICIAEKMNAKMKLGQTIENANRPNSEKT
jgi:hypothetical protein